MERLADLHPQLFNDLFEALGGKAHNVQLEVSGGNGG
jgi:hypothetical protein